MIYGIIKVAIVTCSFLLGVVAGTILIRHAVKIRKETDKVKFNFFQWTITTKLKRRDADERIAFLANKFIEEVVNSGRTIEHKVISKGFGSVEINVHRFGKESPCMDIRSTGNFVVTDLKPTFKKL